jgi:glycosyltransferase involved in cell wall biosynthesis
MKILQCHNYYQYAGGEDQVFAAERWLLESRGHAVVAYTKHNDAIGAMSRWDAAKATFYNRAVYAELRELIRRERPNVMHCTNIFPLISPAAYDAAHDEGVPVVQSLHNYRLLCPKALLMRDGSVCEKCLPTRTFWPGVLHGCYRDDRKATAVVAGMLSAHWARGTWTGRVDRYIALSEFSRRKFIAGGLPAEKITVKPNFVEHDPGVGGGAGGYAIFVGRLSPEKGVQTLLDAWRRIGTEIPLRIVGDGPLVEQVRTAAQGHPLIEYLGRRSHAEVLDLVGAARLLVFPSTCYETFGLSIVEAFARGTPVVASRHGSMAELVEDRRTGTLFPPGSADALAAAVQRLWHSPQLSAMRQAAREEFTAKYTPERNYEMLLDVYRGVTGLPAARAVVEPQHTGELAGVG